MVELGAGTGYMAKLLQDRGLQVQPLDVAPTGNNEYHGNTPNFVTVHRGTVQTLNFMQNASVLVLCYPPPDSSMAHDALRTFLKGGGELLLHIGDFKGLTGSAKFEQLLVQRLLCTYRADCATWGTDASRVTLWTTRSGSKLLLPCVYCEKKESTHRLRLCRMLHFCSESCWKASQTMVHIELAKNSVSLPQGPLQYGDKDLFSPLL